jgi:TolB protein
MAAFAALLLITAEQPAEATFPGGKGKIVFASNRHGGWEIYTIGSAGHNLKRLTDNPAKNLDPTWSADGKRIAFVNGRRRFNTYDIFVMHANGSGKTRVTKEDKIPDPKERGDTAPSFSPNGHQIAFLRLGNIYKIRTDGSHLTRLTRVDTSYYSISGPAWSPEGSKILFGSTDRFDGPSVLETVSPDGSNFSVFAYPDGLGYIGTPDWSPDGSRVVFDGGEDEIYVTVEGGEAQRLTTNQAIDRDPAFSPGGGKIVFSSDRDGDYDLYIMNADGTGKPKQLTNAPGDDRSPSWRPIH